MLPMKMHLRKISMRNIPYPSPFPFLQPHALSTSRPLEVEFQPQVVIHEPKASTLTFTYTVKTADSAAGTHILSQVEHVLEPVRNLVSASNE